ncbi:hypothetical protein C2857_007333 [Epichloe festucae Fl1]|uniref:3-carboxymuconate cyclase n=1 Tax=Epichloe festucae (strain Fl1) TaxID=877507 RepID=A0A7S9PTA8_EPIFF|nr:hypothetical protein C2857_007333 [Epichloe festucae Fl1]
MFTALASLLLAATAQASFLYVSSYDGYVTTLDLKGTSSGRGAARVPLLRSVSSTHGCGGSPSWLTLDKAGSTLFCADEGLTTRDGSIWSFETTRDGLRRLDQVMTLRGPDASHPHETVLDPTGNFMVVPDLGADKIYVFAVSNSADLKLKALPPVHVKPGSGPRHVSFAAFRDKTFMYVVTQLANTIISYEVTYPGTSVQFKQLSTISTHGVGGHVPKQVAAAEIAVSPDSKNLIVSSRRENAFSIPNFDPKNNTKIISDPLINFSIDAETGSLTRIQEVPCGGRVPRHFSFNKAGTLVAVGQQNDWRVVLINRDPHTGKLGSFAGYADVAGPVTSVVFNEKLGS